MAEMARSLGHEINNTLAAMVLRLEMLTEDAPPTGLVRESIDVLDTAARQGTALVGRLRDMARLSRPLLPRPIALAPAVDDAVEAVRARVAASARIALSVEHATAPAVAGDRSEIALAVRELLHNAVDALEGAGAVRVETGARGRFVWCRVIDDGPGIAPELRARAFDPFVTTRGARGRGLGLTLALTVAARHEGDLRLEPGRDGGTIATLEVPAAR
jgi:signal transduction histidine kinase